MILKKCLNAMWITEDDLPFRLSLIPDFSRKILEFAWLKKGSVEFDQEQYNKAVEDLKKTRWLVAWGVGGEEIMLFQQGYEDFSLAVSCGALIKELYYSREHIYDASAEVFYQALKEVMDSLTEKEKEIILTRYGFNDQKLYTLEEAGRKYGITKSAAKSREMSAIKKLRNHKKGLYRSKEFYTLDSTIRETARAQVQAECKRYQNALKNVSILALDLPDDMKNFLAERGCNTLGDFLTFKQTEGFPEEMVSAIRQKKVDFYMEMFDIE